MKTLFSILVIILTASACNTQAGKKNEVKVMSENKIQNPLYSTTDTGKLNISNDEWKKVLPKEVYEIAREKGTERAFTGKYWNSFDS
jgi:hypothetical protein